MDLQLAGKVAVVAGASRGLGRAIALGLVAEGARVALVARGAEALEELRREIEAGGGRAIAIATDVTAPDAPELVRTRAEAELGPVDLLVANAGGNKRSPLVDTTEKDWDEFLDLNLRAHVRFVRALAPGMVERKRGSILFVGSIFGREGSGPGLAIYNATKSALMSASKILAMELAPSGVRVNSLAPGSIRFPGGSWDRRCNEDPEGMARFVEDNIPGGRFGRAEEVADVAVFLLSERASWVTGACWTVDGGQSRSLF